MEGKPRQAGGVHVAAGRGGLAINGNGNIVYAGGPGGAPPTGPDRSEVALTRASILSGMMVYLAIHVVFFYWYYDPEGGSVIAQAFDGAWPLTWQFIFGSMLAFGAATFAAYFLLPETWFRR